MPVAPADVRLLGVGYSGVRRETGKE
jgi:hypothetical protein